MTEADSKAGTRMAANSRLLLLSPAEILLVPDDAALFEKGLDMIPAEAADGCRPLHKVRLATTASSDTH